MRKELFHMNHFFKGLAGALSTVGAYLVYLLGGWDAALTVMFVRGWTMPRGC